MEDAIGRVDDSRGYMGEIKEELVELHHRACPLARPDPEELAARLFDWALHSGLRRYRFLAQQAWDQVPVQVPSPSKLAVLPLCYHFAMVVRKKRSISMPPELDSRIELAAAAEGTSYSGWLAAVARKEFTIRAGLDGVSAFERSHGRFTPDELAEAEAWADEALVRAKRTGTRQRQSA